MQKEFMSVLRFFAFVVFIASLWAGYYLLKNQEKFFGADPNLPSEGSSSRSYSRMQAFVIWAHIAIASGGCALMLE